MFTAKMILTVENEKEKISYIKSLKPEVVSRPKKELIEIKIIERDNDLVLSFTSKELSKLRAALNSFLYLIYSINATLSQVVES